MASRVPFGVEIISPKSSAFPRAVPRFQGAWISWGLHLLNITIPSWPLDLESNPLYPAMFSCSGARSPPPCSFPPTSWGGVTRSPPLLSRSLPNHFLEAWHFIRGRLGQGGCKKKKNKIKYRRFPPAGARRCRRSPVLSLRAPGPGGGNQPLVSPCSLRALRGGKYLFSLPSSRLSSSFQLNPVPPRETLTAPVVFYFFSLVDWYYYYFFFFCWHYRASSKYFWLK